MEIDGWEKQFREDINEYLSTVNLVTITPAEIRNHFEKLLDLDLSEMESVIAEQLSNFIIEKRKKHIDKKIDNKGIRSKSCKVPLSTPLVDFFGTGETEMLKSNAIERIWSYVKLNKLDNGTVVTCDEKLRQLFGVDSFMAHDIQRFLQAHFLKSEYQVYYEMKPPLL